MNVFKVIGIDITERSSPTTFETFGLRPKASLCIVNAKIVEQRVNCNAAAHTGLFCDLDQTQCMRAPRRPIASLALQQEPRPFELMTWLDGRKLDAVIHMGAISDTTATDGDLVMENNFRLSLRLLDWCTQTRTPFIYASSAATYGDGTQGFDDD